MKRTNGNNPEHILNIHMEGDMVICPVTAAFLQALKLKGIYLFNHSLLVGALAERVGISLGLPEARVQILKKAGLLHDIGKLPIPSRILLKPAPLTKREWEIVKTHPARGAETLEPFDGFKEIANIVAQHHEVDNGRGYPYGLKENAISFEAKIVSLCDVYAAVTTERPYKPTFPKVNAIQISMDTVNLGNGNNEAIRELFERISFTSG